MLQAWLDAVNSGDCSHVERYVESLDPSQSVAGLIAFHEQSGGFDLLSVDSIAPDHLGFRVKERASPTVAIGTLVLTAGPSLTVQVFGLHAIPPGEAESPVVLDRAYRRRVIDGIRSDLDQFYVDAALAAAMGKAIETKARAGDYGGETDGDVFAARLQADLRSVSRDKHVTVGFTPFKPPPQTAPSAEDAARFRNTLLETNCAFEEVKVLPDNIGYVKFDVFGPPEICAPTAAAAMGFVAHARAVIFDLRDNTGGSPAMVSFIASYLFDQPTHLNDLYDRHANETRQFWTTPYSIGSSLAKTPVFLLTSSRTFSGAEEFAYDLLQQKRATIVGETTGGGAHPVAPHVVADHIIVGVPFAKAVNPVSKGNWEGSGVEPNVKVPAAEALETAETMLARARTQKTP